MTRRIAIITGAAEGIGRSVATRLARDGFDLGLFDLPRESEKLGVLAALLRQEYGVRVLCVEGDVSREADVQRLVDTVVSELGDVYAVRFTFSSSRIPVQAQILVLNKSTDDCECRYIRKL